MQAFLVVDLFEELRAEGTCPGQVAVFIAQNLFVLQRFHERLAGCVIPRIALAAHADIDSVRLQQVGVIVACVLAAAIGVVHQAGLDASPRQSHAERRQRQLVFHVAIQRPGGHSGSTEKDNPTSVIVETFRRIWV